MNAPRRSRSRRLYYRLESPSQTPEIARVQEATGEIWGKAPRGSTIPAVQAYTGPLPEGARGIEFTAEVEPDPLSPPGQAYWRGPRPGVIVEGDNAKIRVTVTRNTQR
jgi:hypothetical protein